MAYRGGYRSYYGYRARAASPKLRDYKKDISRLSNINDLDIKDLKKIQRFLSVYPEKVLRIEQENAETIAENQRRTAANKQKQEIWAASKKSLEAAYERERIQPLENQINSLRQELEHYKTSFLGGLVSSDVVKFSFGGATNAYRGKRAAEIVEAIKSLWEQRSSRWHARPSIPDPALLDCLPIKKKPKEYAVLTISGLRTRVFFNDFSLEEVENKIADREAAISKEQQKIQEIKARADRTEAAVRNQAKQYLKMLSSQLKKFDACPYCCGPLEQSNAHQDHIHPVSKGGLSVPQNLIIVCSSCNLKKGNKSLRVFLRDQGFDLDSVYDRLDMLGKH